VDGSGRASGRGSFARPRSPRRGGPQLLSAGGAGQRQGLRPPGGRGPGPPAVLPGQSRRAEVGQLHGDAKFARARPAVRGRPADVGREALRLCSEWAGAAPSADAPRNAICTPSWPRPCRPTRARREAASSPETVVAARRCRGGRPPPGETLVQGFGQFAGGTPNRVGHFGTWGGRGLDRVREKNLKKGTGRSAVIGPRQSFTQCSRPQ
jgi:hypothetical protein